MNRLFVIAGLVILVVALVFLNQGIKKSGLPDNDDAPPPATAQTAPPPARPRTAAPSAGPSALPAEQTVGNPATAKHHIVVGWSYSDANQQKPEALNAPLQAIQSYVQKTGGSVSAEIVNVDVPAADRSPAAKSAPGNGIYVDGKPVFTGDVSTASPPKVMGAIQAATK
ncbi:MAG: hypothetical protein ACRYFS_12620 [Janthinobacterium lividum]